MMKFSAIAAVAGLGLLLGGCEVGTKEYEQIGYRGTGAQGVVDQSQLRATLKKIGAVPAPPYELTAEMIGGERAGAAYQNVQVLGDISTEQFNYLMAAMVTWIAPGEGEGQGCNYCHNANNMASDRYDNGKLIYTKIVARRMIQMNRNINGSWGKHVAPAGVTCWTCHRGKAVPANKWAINPDGDSTGAPLMGNKRGQNTPLQTVAYASLPSDPFSAFLRDNQEIKLAGKTALRTPANLATTKSAEHTYGLMMHMSQGLGVNCSYCHNAGNFASWSLSRPQRGTAWYGIRMVRNINNDYIESLAGIFPASRKGPLGDPYKVNCTTCHQGQAKPMNGYAMLKDYPALRGALGPMTVKPAMPHWQAPAGPAARTFVAARAPMALPVAYTDVVVAPAVSTAPVATAAAVDGAP